MTHLTKEEIKERNKYFNKCKKLQSKIVCHDRYNYFEPTQIEYSILRMVAEAESYNDLPNTDVIGFLKRIKERMLKY